MGVNALSKLADQCYELFRKFDRVAQVYETEDYRRWIIESLDKGGKAVHRWTSQKSKAPPLPATIYDLATGTIHSDPQDQADYYSKWWGTLWAQRSHEASDTADRMRLVRVIAACAYPQTQSVSYTHLTLPTKRIV